LKEYRTKYYSNNTLLKRAQRMPPIPKAAKMKENCGMGSQPAFFYKYRVMTAMKVKTDIIVSITAV
jgi:hypothetical protein